jgi:hypothetical protein
LPGITQEKLSTLKIFLSLSKGKSQSQIKNQNQSQKNKNNKMEGTRPLTGPALTNDLCGQYFKIKVKVKTAFVLANAEINKLTLTF